MHVVPTTVAGVQLPPCACVTATYVNTVSSSYIDTLTLLLEVS